MPDADWWTSSPDDLDDLPRTVPVLEAEVRRLRMLVLRIGDAIDDARDWESLRVALRKARELVDEAKRGQRAPDKNAAKSGS